MAKKGIYQRYNCISTAVYNANWEYWAGLFGYNYEFAFTSYEATATGFNLLGSLGMVEDQDFGTFVHIAGVQNSQSCINLQRIVRGYYVSTFVNRNGDSIIRLDSSAEAKATGTKVSYTYSRGTYLNDIIADYGSLPANGRHTDGYWYVFVKMASNLKANVSGVWRDAPTGWGNVNGIWKPQSELKVNVNGIYK